MCRNRTAPLFFWGRRHQHGVGCYLVQCDPRCRVRVLLAKPMCTGGHVDACQVMLCQRYSSAVLLQYCMHLPGPDRASRGRMQIRAALQRSRRVIDKKNILDWPVSTYPRLIGDELRANLDLAILRRRACEGFFAANWVSAWYAGCRECNLTDPPTLSSLARQPPSFLNGDRRQTGSWRQTPFCRLLPGDGPMED